MKKERAIKIGILSAVFVLAIFIFSYWTNRGNAGVTADMGSATLPTISFEVEGQEANLLVGHKREMNIVAMRDTIAIYGDKEVLAMNLYPYGNDIDSLTYEVYTLDGKDRLLEKTVDEVKEKVSLKLGDSLKKGKEGVLKITLYIGENPLYYYTRIMKDNGYHVKECVSYVQELHNNLINKENDDEVKKVMESNAQGNNSSFQHVTIHSSLEQIMWGELKPEVVGEPLLEIKEARKAYTSVLLSYRVRCAGDNNNEEIYQVQEFFKLAYKSEQIYLLEYDRTMEEVFATSNVVLSAKGVILGIAAADTSYKVNSKGTIVSFIQANELWSYSKEGDAFALVYSFSDSEKEDIRNYTDKHSIDILSMDDDGNMTFSVCGYMNRGPHEGESGIAIYYYNMEQNFVEEAAFIPSTQSQVVIQEELSELAYYNKEQDVLYVMVGDELLQVKPQKNQQEVLMEGLQKGQYVASKDGHLLAYQKETDGNMITEIRDFAKGTTQQILAEQGELVIPLGFVGNDFVYGLSFPENAGRDTSGAEVQAMHRLEIRNEENKIIKQYQKAGGYILGATVQNNQITLRQGTKNGNLYSNMEEDYITNNETSANEFISFKSYVTDLKKTQYRLVFSEGIQDKKAKTLKPKQVLQEIPTILEMSNEDEQYFYVHGLGKQAGAFREAGDAIELASKLAGVVVSPKQNYVWEEGNRVAWYRNFEVSGFTVGTGESTLAACVRKVLSYEKKSADVSAEMATKSAETILGEQLGTEAIRFHDCSVKDMFYLIDKGVPVIALKDAGNAVLLVGYDARTVTYLEPASGGTYTSSIEKMNEMLAGSGRSFIGYVR